MDRVLLGIPHGEGRGGIDAEKEVGVDHGWRSGRKAGGRRMMPCCDAVVS
jgi:hypothetical protein